MAESPAFALPVRERSAAAAPPTSIEDLPNEVLSQILTSLDGPSAPSDARLNERPSESLFVAAAGAPPPPLKSASVVSHRWRAVLLPVLFRHVVWPIDRRELPLVEQEPDHVAAVPLLDFIRTHGLGPSVLTMTMIVRDRPVGDEGSCDKHYTPLLGMPPMEFDEPAYDVDNNWLWDAVFGLVDPLRFTLVAQPHMLGSLLSRTVDMSYVWSFGNLLSVLSLSRSRRDPPPRPDVVAADCSHKGKEKEKEREAAHTEGRQQPSRSSRPPRVPCRLFTMRAWTSLLLNEGSLARVYSAVGFSTRRPPSIMEALLGAEMFPNDERLIPASVRSLSYVSVFPLTIHIDRLALYLPPLDRLYVQITPRPGDADDVIAEARASQHVRGRRRVVLQDLWKERNSSYSRLMAAMTDSYFRDNWRGLLEFESGDTADREAWGLAVEYVNTLGPAWRVAGEGVFRRREDLRRA